MSLGIFAFDLAAIINGLSNFIETVEPETAAAINEISFDKTEDVLQNATGTASIIDDVLMAAALSGAVTSVISNAEAAQKEDSTQKIAAAKPSVRSAPAKLAAETRKEIERLIKSLQISVIHNYKSTDIIDETVSLNNVANFRGRKPPEETDDKKRAAEQQKSREEQKLESLREELKKAILRNNSDV